jgi:threonine/homoserine/homoserine lactone efflux protein
MEFLLGVLLAAIYVISPGPVNLATVQRGWIGGFQAALAVQLGALAGDLAYALLALTGLGLFVADAAAQILLGIAGASLLLCLGGAALCQSWRAGRIPRAHVASTACDASKLRHFWMGLVLAVANPYGIAFWLSVDSAILRSSHHHTVAFLSGFFLSNLLAALIIALLVGRSRLCVTPWVLRLASCGFGLALIGFGLTLGYAVVQGY